MQEASRKHHGETCASMNSAYFLGCRKAVVVARCLLQRRQLRPAIWPSPFHSRSRIATIRFARVYLRRHAARKPPPDTFRSVPLFSLINPIPRGHETRQSASLPVESGTKKKSFPCPANGDVSGCLLGHERLLLSSTFDIRSLFFPRR